MAALHDITIKPELRTCEVNGELCYFHCWEQASDVLWHGISAQVYGIVEFADCIKRVDPTAIRFDDEKNHFLQMCNKERKRQNENHESND